MDLEWSKTYVQYIGEKIIVFSPFLIKSRSKEGGGWPLRKFQQKMCFCFLTF